MLITFGILNKKLLIPFIFPFFVKLRRFIRDEEYKQIKNPFFKIFCSFLSYALCGFLYLIVLCQSKNKKKLKNKNNVRNLSKGFLLVKVNTVKEKELIDLNELDSDKNPIENEEKKMKKLQRKKQFIFIIFISFLFLIASSIHDIWKDLQKINIEYRQTLSILFELIFLTSFSIIFLKYQIYLHQKFSLFILVLCLITFFVESIIYNDDTFSNIVRYFIYFFSSELFYCIGDVLGKKYLIKYFDNIYLFMFKIGIIGIIPILLYDGIVELFFNDENGKYHGIIAYFKILSESKGKIYLFLLDLFFGFIWQISLWLTIYYFSPLHFIILETLGEFIETTLNIIDHNLQPNRAEYKSEQIITFYIIYPIVIFIVLVFNEIIILNFCGLQYNTRYYIILRQKIDGSYDVDKNGKLVPANYFAQSSITGPDDEDDESNNEVIFK